MVVETKFSIGDQVFVIEDNKVHNCTVTNIGVRISEVWESGVYRTSISTRYQMRNPTMTRTFQENEIFKTKYELFESL